MQERIREETKGRKRRSRAYSTWARDRKESVSPARSVTTNDAGAR